MAKENKPFLLCVDSDGCVMDTMNEKHHRYFGPVLVDVYGLKDIADVVTTRWNRINLYSETRGINRFLGLVCLLKELQADGLYQAEISSLEAWTKSTAPLANDALRQAFEASGEECLNLALRWSEQVNDGIRNHEQKSNVFAGAAEALEMASEYADLVVVSSANQEALLKEWQPYLNRGWGLRIMSQNDGSKSACIHSLLASGYDPSHTLMIGDAPGDLKSAKDNQVFFYPILAGRETECWEHFEEAALLPLLEGNFTDTYQMELKETFLSHLGGTL